jgi:hypothetical protein
MTISEGSVAVAIRAKTQHGSNLLMVTYDTHPEP